MTAPEKIWTPANGQSIIPGGIQRWPTDVEYTRSDLCLELVAAAYETAANVVSRAGHSLDAEIRSLTPADATAALAARDAQIREAALDAVLKEVEGYLPEFGAGEPQDGTDRIIDQCWRDFHKIVHSLISKDKADG